MPDKLNPSNRLKQLADQVPRGSRFADIGTDHAFLPCFVCLRDPKAFAIAGEARWGPHNSANNTILTYDLTSRVINRFGDGLDVIEITDQIDTVVISGMGGKLITAILNRGKDQLRSVQRLILQPNGGEFTVRKYLMDNGFGLEKEIILEENAQIYEILVAVRGGQGNAYNTATTLEMQLMFGPLLLQEKSQIFLRKWRLEYMHRKKILKRLENAKIKKTETQQKYQQQLAMIEEVLR